MFVSFSLTPPELFLVQTFGMVCLLFAGHQDSFKTTDILKKEDQKHKISQKINKVLKD